jgi:hypothetical protein
VSRRHIVGALAVCLAVAGQPGVAAADAAGPTNWRSSIVSVSPVTEAVTLSIEGGDAFVRAVVSPGHELVVLGYSDEPYIRIDGSGAVFENQRSAATYINTRRDGTAAVPATVDADAEPDWKQVGEGGAWAWHDHRAHWMGSTDPIGMAPGDALPAQVVPLQIDGTPVAVTVVTVLVGGPSWWPAAAGALVGLALIGATLRRRTAGAVALLGLGGAALLVGLGEFVSLPSETGPRPVWWALPAIAVACAATIALLRGLRSKAVFSIHGLALVGAVQLALWAWIRRAGLTRGVLPTDLPFTLDRAVTAAALVGGLAAVLVELTAVTRTATQSPSARSIADAS